MSKKFDWQTEDDFNWDALPAEEITTKPSPKRRRWLVLLFILLVLAGTGGLIYRQVDRRVEENTTAMRADIISSHNLLQIADAEQDEELFYSVLSGSSSSWTVAQKKLFDAGLLHDRAPLGLSALELSDPVPVEEGDTLSVNFTSDLREAEVIAKKPFNIEIGHGLSETVYLQETTIYRQGRERWLLAPPQEKFWGEQTFLRGSRLSLTTPDRDAELAGRLRTDLERKLDEMCRTVVDIQCPTSLAIEAVFSTDPASLVTTNNPLINEEENGVLQIILPAPTLTGIPVDEQGYQALFRAYAGQLVTAVISHLVDFNCCRHVVFHQALVDYQLDRLSIKPWPISTIDYQRILDEQVQIADIDRLWRSQEKSALSGPEGWQVYAFLDYLLKTYPELSATLQRELNRHETLNSWLDDSFAQAGNSQETVSGSDLIRQLWLNAYKQLFSTASDSLTLPAAQDLEISCVAQDEGNTSGQRSGLYRYDVRQGEWVEEYTTDITLFMNPLPDDNRLVILEFDPNNRWWQTRIWQEGSINPLVTGRENQVVSFGSTDPAGSSLTAFVFSPESEEADITLIDLQQCSQFGCPSRTLPSIPIWSPDGTRALFSDEPNAQIALIQSSRRTILFDSTVETPNLQLYETSRQNLMEEEEITAVADLTNIGRGHAPFWLDNETVGFVSLANGRFSRPGQAVEYTPAGQDDPQVLLRMDDLLESMPDPASVERVFWIHYVMVNPADPNILFVLAMSGWDQEAHLFSYDRATGAVQHLMHNNYSADHTLSLSPDGRFQLLTGRKANQPGIEDDNALLLLHDRTLDKTTPFLIRPAGFPPFPTYDWSNDGRWLTMMLDRNLIGLYSPQQDELKLIETPQDNCTSPAWINRPAHS